jgi:hypothetical protein
MYLYLLLVGYVVNLLLPTIHHFRVGQRSGLSGLIGLGQVFRLKDEGRNVSTSRNKSLPFCWFWFSEAVHTHS